MSDIKLFRLTSGEATELVSNIGHWGIGNVEVTLSNSTDLDAVKPFINIAYQGRAVAASQ